MNGNSAIDWNPGTVLLDEYRIERFLGEGGTGEVFLVRSMTDALPFAVKTLRGSILHNEDVTQNFIHELRTWSLLPKYPHIVTCLFFRTIGDRMAIFSEYVDGGSLKQWIQSGRTKNIETILDVAIQSGWALETAHRNGVIHQDIKPANVLMTHDGVAKLTDFGIAKALRPEEKGKLAEAGTPSPEVSSGGMTLAYCSPEQALRRMVSYRTDIWSWGVMLLELFIGRVTWRIGSLARVVLESVNNRQISDIKHTIPPEITQILERCFQEDPMDRWNAMSEITKQVENLYAVLCGKPYHRQQTTVPYMLTNDTIMAYPSERLHDWRDPSGIIISIARKNPQVNAELHQLLQETETHGSMHAHALADMETYHRMQRTLEAMIRNGHTDLQNELEEILVNKARIHDFLHDYSGALMLFDDVLNMVGDPRSLPSGSPRRFRWMRILRHRPESLIHISKIENVIACQDEAIQTLLDLEISEHLESRDYNLASLCMNRGTKFHILDSYQAALNDFNSAEEICCRHLTGNEHTSFRRLLGMIYINKAIILTETGRYFDSAELLDKAMQIWENALKNEASSDVLRCAGISSINKGTALSYLGRHDDAIASMHRAIDYFNRYIQNQEWHTHFSELTHAYSGVAKEYAAIGQYENAMLYFSKAEAIWNRLIFEEGRTDLRPKLASLYLNKANAISPYQRHEEAAELYQKAEAIYNRLVDIEGRLEFTADLGLIYLNLAGTYDDLKRFDLSESLHRKAIRCWERVVLEQNQVAFRNVLAITYLNYSSMLIKQESFAPALEYMDKSIDLLEKLLEDKNYRILRGEYETARAWRGILLIKLGRQHQGKPMLQSALKALDSEADRTRRVDLTTVVSEIRKFIQDNPDLAGCL